MISFSGPSGCGKSTLLNIIGLLDIPTSGESVIFGNANPKPFSKEAVKILRNNIGYLFQDFALLDNKSVKYNLIMALSYEKLSRIQKVNRINDTLKKVGLEGFIDKKLSECSGGEQQRIAIARLLLKPCNVVLCDEPTGSLDEENRDKVMELLLLLKEEGKTVVIVSHDPDVISYSDVSYVFENGRLKSKTHI